MKGLSKAKFITITDCFKLLWSLHLNEADFYIHTIERSACFYSKCEGIEILLESFSPTHGFCSTNLNLKEDIRSEIIQSYMYKPSDCFAVLKSLMPESELQNQYSTIQMDCAVLLNFCAVLSWGPLIFVVHKAGWLIVHSSAFDVCPSAVCLEMFYTFYSHGFPPMV